MIGPSPDPPSGELELIELIEARLNSPDQSGPAEVIVGIGDDAAVTAPPGLTATSVDLVVEDVHFRLETATMYDVGHKALASALSDLAAMGAVAGEAYVGLGLPDRLLDRAIELCDGIAAVADRHRVALVGGDVSAAEQLVVAVTVVGHARGERRLVRRSGSSPGSVVVVTGALGAAAAGRLLLDASTDQAGEAAATAIARQLRPAPRLAAGEALAELGAEAMIDLSDGLVTDARRLAVASGVRIELDPERVPADPCLAELAPRLGVDGTRLALGGGEDYELLAVIAAERVREAAAALRAERIPLTVIGAVREGEGVGIEGFSEADVGRLGFEHLRRR